MGKLYMDCTSGVSGNMVIGAFLDLGMPMEYLEENILKVLDKEVFELVSKKISFFGSEVTYFNTIVKNGQEAGLGRIVNAMRPSEALKLIEDSTLNDEVKRNVMKILGALIEAKMRAHGCSMEEVEFSYEGFSDTLIDVIGTCAGLYYFSVSDIISTPLQVGSGKISLGQREMEIPSPMTRILLEGKPYFSTRLEGEMVTPTGAAIVSVLAGEYSLLKDANLKRIGYGLATETAGLDGMTKLDLSRTRWPIAGIFGSVRLPTEALCVAG
jgi:uncharacterized protein (DUF111 family)